MAKKHLGELLIKQNILSLEQLEKAKKEMSVSGGRLSSAISKLGFVSDREMAEFVAVQHNVQAIDLEHFEIPKEILKQVPKELCIKHCMIPVTQSLGTLVVAVADPSNIYIRDDLRFLTESKIEMVVAAEPSILACISKYYDVSDLGSVISDLESSEEASSKTIGDQVEYVDEGAKSEDAPIIKFVNLMLTESVKLRASDIHIEPYEKRFRVRFRIDGTLHEKVQPPAGTAKAISSRIKIMAKLDISEKRRPQDGRLKVRKKSGGEIEFRVSVLPTLYGEKIVLRLLDKSKLSVDMASLGFEPEDLKLLHSAIHRPNGIVLITGPTGSGKSTTIYSALNEINTPKVNISTAEDPVEMNIEGINQVQMHHEIGVNFTSTLRSFLRQDPDIIFVGEIRDQETAQIAFKAAATGHLVVSTLHTNDAPATIVRLTEMGIAPFLVNSTVSLVVAQRLVGLICDKCKRDADVPKQVLLDLGVREDEIDEYHPKSGEGCMSCNHTGIRGRVAIHELMEMTPGIKDGIMESVTTRELRQIALNDGMRSLRRNAILKMKAGLTTVEEVIGTTLKD